jgi:enoyl-CoA hydratase/carnithine racemase
MTTGYAKIALTGDYGISWLLTRLAGTSRARELMYLPERLDARRCEALGLVNRVVSDSELQQEAFAVARCWRTVRGARLPLSRTISILRSRLIS